MPRDSNLVHSEWNKNMIIFFLHSECSSVNRQAMIYKIYQSNNGIMMIKSQCLMCFNRQTVYKTHSNYSAYTRSQGYKTFFMLNSTEDEISTAHKS